MVNKQGDIYLDELQERVTAICGIRPSISTICRTLKRGGYSLKKVSYQCLMCFWSCPVTVFTRSHVLQRNGMYSYVLNLLSGWHANTVLSIWSLWMKALQIGVTPTAILHGLLEATKLFREYSLCAEKGTAICFYWYHYPIEIETFRFSILPALTLQGILACDIVEGSFDASRFASFIDGLLGQMNPWPQPNSVIVMDNCRIHKDPEILEMITSR